MFGWWPKTFQVGFVCCHGARAIEASHWPFESWLPSCIAGTHQRLQRHKERLKPQVTIAGMAKKMQVAANNCKSHCLAYVVTMPIITKSLSMAMIIIMVIKIHDEEPLSIHSFYVYHMMLLKLLKAAAALA